MKSPGFGPAFPIEDIYMDGGINFGPYGPIPFVVGLAGCFLWIVVAYLRTKVLPIAPALIAVVMMLGSMWTGISYSSKSEEWEAFKVAHNCKVVGKRDGHSNDGIGVTTRGSVGFILGDKSPDQTGYLCNDGVTYWKNER